jgi:hypothetical protein
VGKWITNKAFAELCGVTPQAVGKAIKQGRVNRLGAGIDPKDPANVAYMETAKYNGISQPSGPRVKPPAPPTDLDQLELGYPTDRTTADLAKIISQTKKLNLEIAAKASEMLPREFVAQAFGKLNAAILDYFLPLGERIAPEAASMAGTSDPEVIRSIQEYIEDEVSRGLESVKRQALEQGAESEGEAA